MLLYPFVALLLRGDKKGKFAAPQVLFPCSAPAYSVAFWVKVLWLRCSYADPSPRSVELLLSALSS
ncbi:MAG TPA: hypothetical protein VKZ76_07455, partial [Edaphocola sp.]|nr:hypothetical protein [Edaphocola sp.]